MGICIKHFLIYNTFHLYQYPHHLFQLTLVDFQYKVLYRLVVIQLKDYPSKINIELILVIPHLKIIIKLMFKKKYSIFYIIFLLLCIFNEGGNYIIYFIILYIHYLLY